MRPADKLPLGGHQHDALFWGFWKSWVQYGAQERNTCTQIVHFYFNADVLLAWLMQLSCINGVQGA
jgi:amino acid permease